MESTIIYVLDLIGTIVFAVSGALAAGRKRMDIFGVVVLGCVTALGGGTVRDVILGNHPVFWVTSTEYLAVASVTAIMTFISARRWHPPRAILMYADALGLAVFTVIGFNKGVAATGSYPIGMVMGMTTGVVGGMIRDVLAGEIPLILRREIYASASLSGAALLSLFTWLQLPEPVITIAGALTTLFLRIAALHWNLALPLFRLDDSETE